MSESHREIDSLFKKKRQKSRRSHLRQMQQAYKSLLYKNNELEEEIFQLKYNAWISRFFMVIAISALVVRLFF